MSSITKKQAVEETFALLIKCMMQSKHQLVELGSKEGLTGMQTTMMLMLDAPRPMHSFTKVFNCDASNITGITDGLEQKKLASRFPAESDRRIKMIKLSSKGEIIRTKLLNQMIKNQSSILISLSDHELNTLTELLKKITPKDS